MALQKTITTSIGINTEYHVITAIHWYPHVLSAHIDISSYVSQAAFEGGYNPLEVNQFEFTGAACPFNLQAGLNTAYNVILQTEKFQGATIIT